MTATTDGGVVETHQHIVEAGTGVAMLPDDLHSIHIDTPSLNFHCYGLALERLDDRVFFDPRNHAWKTFNSVSNIYEARPRSPSHPMTEAITSAELRDRLIDGGEIALLDAREQGVYHRSHLFHAACVPLSHLELVLGDLVPRRSTPIVWCDDGSTDGLAARAAGRAAELGWTDNTVLTGGTAAWAADGGELYFGRQCAIQGHSASTSSKPSTTPRLPATEVKQLIDAARPGARAMLWCSTLDRSTRFRRMSIPSGYRLPWR